MTLNSSLHQIKLRERRLQVLRTHQEVFDVEPTFPIPLFEDAVLEIEGSCGIECSCKVEGGQLLAGRFQVCNDIGKTWPESLTHALKLLDKIENRLGIRLNRDSFEQFAAAHLGSQAIQNNTIGINLGSKLEDSSVMIYFHLDDHEDPEELARTAIALDGGYYSAELTQVLFRDLFIIGFELFFDGRSQVELGPVAPAKPGTLGNRGKYFTPYIQKHFSAKVNSLFRRGPFLLMATFSSAFVKPLLWFGFAKIKDVPNLFLFNSLGDRIYNFCQSQSCITDSCLVATESEFEKIRLENFYVYYNQRGECQPHPHFDFS